MISTHIAPLEASRALRPLNPPARLMGGCLITQHCSFGASNTFANGSVTSSCGSWRHFVRCLSGTRRSPDFPQIPGGLCKSQKRDSFTLPSLTAQMTGKAMYTSVLTVVALLTTGTFPDPSIYICSRDDSGSSPAWSCGQDSTALKIKIRRSESSLDICVRCVLVLLSDKKAHSCREVPSSCYWLEDYWKQTSPSARTYRAHLRGTHYRKRFFSAARLKCRSHATFTPLPGLLQCSICGACIRYFVCMSHRCGVAVQSHSDCIDATI